MAQEVCSIDWSSISRLYISHSIWMESWLPEESCEGRVRQPSSSLSKLVYSVNSVLKRFMHVVSLQDLRALHCRPSSLLLSLCLISLSLSIFKLLLSSSLCLFLGLSYLFLCRPLLFRLRKLNRLLVEVLLVSCHIVVLRSFYNLPHILILWIPIVYKQLVLLHSKNKSSILIFGFC